MNPIGSEIDSGSSLEKPLPIIAYSSSWRGLKVTDIHNQMQQLTDRAFQKEPEDQKRLFQFLGWSTILGITFIVESFFSHPYLSIGAGVSMAAFYGYGIRYFSTPGGTQEKQDIANLSLEYDILLNTQTIGIPQNFFRRYFPFRKECTSTEQISYSFNQLCWIHEWLTEQEWSDFVSEYSLTHPNQMILLDLYFYLERLSPKSLISRMKKCDCIELIHEEQFCKAFLHKLTPDQLASKKVLNQLISSLPIQWEETTPPPNRSDRRKTFLNLIHSFKKVPD